MQLGQFHVPSTHTAAASQVAAKKRTTDIKRTVADLGAVAYNQGVLPDELAQLISLITARSHLDQASLNSIIRNLYPVGSVSEDIVLRIIGALGLGELKPSLVLQSALLQWLILVYHVLDPQAQAVLSRAYSVLFNLLDVSAIRPQLFHILAIVTRRRHVQHYRIQALLNLTRQHANDRHLVGLLRVYRNYYPEIIVAGPGKGSTFKLPDPEWKARLAEIQRAHRELEQSSSDAGPRDGFKTIHQHLAGNKAAKGLCIPGVQTSHAHETSITLEEVDSAESLAANMERIEMPDHLVAVLVDPLLQKLMMVRPDKDWHRAWAWMDMQISEILNGDAEEDALVNCLQVMGEYAQATKLTRFLAALESSMDGSTEAQCDLLHLYTALIHQWGILLLLSTDSDSDADSDSIPPHTSASLNTLLQHANKLGLTLLQTAPTEATLLSLLSLYDRVVAIYTHSSLLRALQITVPPTLLIYTVQFSTSLATVSRLCALLTAYKQACAESMANATRKLGPAYDKKQVSTFNGFLMDICNCLWRGKAFTKTDTTSRGCLVPDAVVAVLTGYVASLTESGASSEMTLAGLFSMSYSPVLSLQALDYVRMREEQEDLDVELRARHAGPVTQRSLAQLARKGGLELSWHEYRLGVLRYLEAREMKGVPELMYSTMKNLVEAKSKA
ncbi:Mis6-domain-containing protein [Coniella lustricola]|uniref:Mis6-domain-containing protein n=1 Tax=Coniella lustricola TaxID=2025994 RepID=A0A2T2ZZG2_9PEZI|nr:Mis6-domain-containing protein [Coniella lustricola]